MGGKQVSFRFSIDTSFEIFEMLQNGVQEQRIEATSLERRRHQILELLQSVWRRGN